MNGIVRVTVSGFSVQGYFVLTWGLEFFSLCLRGESNIETAIDLALLTHMSGGRSPPYGKEILQCWE